MAFYLEAERGKLTAKASFVKQTFPTLGLPQCSFFFCFVFYFLFLFLFFSKKLKTTRSINHSIASQQLYQGV